MHRLFLIVAAVLAATPAFAQEPVGCDRFKWPLDRERALLLSPDAQKVASGTRIERPIASAVILALVPFAEARLPVSPERPPKVRETFAGFVRFAAPDRSADYRVSLSDKAWIDLVQREKIVKSGPFTGATGCNGVRKSVTFTLPAESFIVQFSSAARDQIGVVVTPAGP